jgi:hypothetical protein
LGLSAGDALSGIVILQHPWAGDDGVDHVILDARNASGYGWVLYKGSDDYLYISVNRGGSVKYKRMAVNSTNMPAGDTNVISFSLATDNTQRIFLDGTEGTGTSGSSDREANIGTNLKVGLDYNDTNHVDGTMPLYLFKDYVFSTDEHTRLSQLGCALPRYRRVS